MNKLEAREIAEARAEELRHLSWTELRDRYLNNPETVETVGAMGVTYQVETQAWWDGKEGGDLRILVSVDDGGWRTLRPLSEDFIIAPDGSFVGE